MIICPLHLSDEVGPRSQLWYVSNDADYFTRAALIFYTEIHIAFFRWLIRNLGHKASVRNRFLSRHNRLVEELSVFWVHVVLHGCLGLRFKQVEWRISFSWGRNISLIIVFRLNWSKYWVLHGFLLFLVPFIVWLNFENLFLRIFCRLWRVSVLEIFSANWNWVSKVLSCLFIILIFKFILKALIYWAIHLHKGILGIDLYVIELFVFWLWKFFDYMDAFYRVTPIVDSNLIFFSLSYIWAIFFFKALISINNRVTFPREHLIGAYLFIMVKGFHIDMNRIHGEVWSLSI